MTEHQDFHRLFLKYIDRSANADELQTFFMMISQHSTQEELEHLVDAEIRRKRHPFNLEKGEKQAILDNVYRLSRNQHPINSKGRYSRLLKGVTIAASVLLVLCTVDYFMSRKQTPEQAVINKIYDAVPGGNKAILTLANGKQIILTAVKEGRLARENNVAISKTKNGNIVYHTDQSASSKGQQPVAAYNMITTPRGGQYLLILTDGTSVMLNASSSLKYPVSFTGNERSVELTGEAYFQVAHNASEPFRVISNGQTVEVLGTHFNINAYANEPAVKTALLEGSVKITQNSTGISSLLKPGQQSIISGNKLEVKDADMEEAVAWKNGYFMFESESIRSIMRKIARWYDVEVIFKGDIPTDNFGGTVSRFSNVSQVLKKLELTGSVHFKIEAGAITVTK
jgi:transmembrane sensor